jgi:hypothetical protein
LYRCLRHVQLYKLQLAQSLFGRLLLFDPQYEQLRVEEWYHECHSFGRRFCSSRLATSRFRQWHNWQWRHWRQRRSRIWILCGCAYHNGPWPWLYDHRPARRCDHHYCGRWRLGFRIRKRSWHRSRHHNCTFRGHNHYYCWRWWLWTRHWSRHRPGNGTRHRSGYWTRNWTWHGSWDRTWNWTRKSRHRSRHRSWNRPWNWPWNWPGIDCLCCLDCRVDHCLQWTNHSFNIWCQHSHQRRICNGKHADCHYDHGLHFDIHLRAHSCLYRPRCNSIGQWWSTGDYDHSWRRQLHHCHAGRNQLCYSLECQSIFHLQNVRHKLPQWYAWS